MRKYRDYSDDEVISAVKTSYSIAGSLKKLGLKAAGGNYVHFKKTIQRLGLCTKHWTGAAWNRGQQLKDWSSYTKAARVKIHLIKERGNKCESCLNETWVGHPIKLEIHHVDGDRTNNTLLNLQLLCPNCHSFTHNYKNKKRVAQVGVEPTDNEF